MCLSVVHQAAKPVINPNDPRTAAKPLDDVKGGASNPGAENYEDDLIKAEHEIQKNSQLIKNAINTTETMRANFEILKKIKETSDRRADGLTNTLARMRLEREKIENAKAECEKVKTQILKSQTILCLHAWLNGPQRIAELDFAFFKVIVHIN
eukprot:TRINITY_DN5116_c0_g1_i1.p1 TRINITY_DN5116_c0_g1~~TRINITY_DN5116_c0_g1_i1.p1  ORF type:complete len:153 (+),score=19.69 TRINITY_DN5116_c0_g1_i1:335-793(+)